MEASLQSELGNAVQKAGKKFEIVDHKLSMRNLLSFIECSRRNNDTAYYVHTSLISKDVYSTLCAGGGAFTDVNPAECHACLFFKGELSPVCWQSIAAIIKWITREYKCDVCMIKNIPTDGCHECGFRICAECLIKLTLPTDVQDIDYDPIRHKGKAMVKYDCPQCRQVCYNDLNDKYYQVMDRLENFSQDQARMIVKLSKLDPRYQQKRQRYQVTQQYRKAAHYSNPSPSNTNTINKQTESKKSNNSPEKSRKKKGKQKSNSQGWNKGFLL